MSKETQPRIVVFSHLFPNPSQPAAGIFIRERLFRVGEHLPMIVVAPVAWFPGQSVIRLFRPHFRPKAPKKEQQQGVWVYRPHFFSVPGIFKFLDGYFLALSCYFTLKRIKKEFNFNHIDAHFAYPDGFAATKLAQWLKVPVTITLRGTEIRHANTPNIKPLLIEALKSANEIFSVSDSLKQHVVQLGIDANKVTVIGNGVDTEKFYPLDKQAMRQKLAMQDTDQILVTVGGLVERKGFHRVIEVIPELLKDFPNLQYLIIGGPNAEGDWTAKLHKMVEDLALTKHVHFLGTMPPTALKEVLSAADIFVLSTRNEGWANVILEAMACGLPVIASDVGGNAEVVCKDSLGKIIPFNNKESLLSAIQQGLNKNWHAEQIIQYAKENSWDNRVSILLDKFSAIQEKHINKCRIS